MKASDLLRERGELKGLLAHPGVTRILRFHAEACIRDIDAALVQAGITPPGRTPTDHHLSGPVRP